MSSATGGSDNESIEDSVPAVDSVADDVDASYTSSSCAGLPGGGGFASFIDLSKVVSL